MNMAYRGQDRYIHNMYIILLLLYITEYVYGRTIYIQAICIIYCLT